MLFFFEKPTYKSRLLAKPTRKYLTVATKLCQIEKASGLERRPEA